MPRETQQTISAWIEETFGPAGSNARVVARANEEMAELLKAVTTEDNHPKLAEEAADVVIVLCRLMSRLGVDLHEEIDRKMAVNRARTWTLDGSGCGYHDEKKNEGTDEEMAFGEVCRAKCGAPARYVGGGKCVYVSAMTNDLRHDEAAPARGDEVCFPLPSNPALLAYVAKHLPDLAGEFLP